MDLLQRHLELHVKTEQRHVGHLAFPFLGKSGSGDESGGECEGNQRGRVHSDHGPWGAR